MRALLALLAVLLPVALSGQPSTTVPADPLPSSFSHSTPLDHIVTSFESGGTTRYVSLQGVLLCSNSRPVQKEEEKKCVRVIVGTIERVGLLKIEEAHSKRLLQDSILRDLRTLLPEIGVDFVWIGSVVIQ